MEIVLIWILFGVVSSVVANNKGRSGAKWFWLGVLLGPFGLVLAFVVSPQRHVVESRTLQSGTMKRCPFCAEIIRVQAMTCRYCGQDLPRRAMETITHPGKRTFPTNQKITGPASRRHCPHCAGSNRANAVVCQFCGESMSSVGTMARR